MSLVLIGKDLLLEETKWVPGIYIYINIHIHEFKLLACGLHCLRFSLANMKLSTGSSDRGPKAKGTKKRSESTGPWISREDTTKWLLGSKLPMLGINSSHLKNRNPYQGHINPTELG